MFAFSVFYFQLNSGAFCGGIEEWAEIVSAGRVFEVEWCCCFIPISIIGVAQVTSRAHFFWKYFFNKTTVSDYLAKKYVILKMRGDKAAL